MHSPWQFSYSRLSYVGMGERDPRVHSSTYFCNSLQITSIAWNWLTLDDSKRTHTITIPEITNYICKLALNTHICYSKIVYIGILQTPWNFQGFCEITFSLRDFRLMFRVLWSPQVKKWFHKLPESFRDFTKSLFRQCYCNIYIKNKSFVKLFTVYKRKQ